MILTKFTSAFKDFIRPNIFLVHIITPFAHSAFLNQNLSFLCRDATFPFYTLNVQKLNYNNLNRNFAGSIDYDPATFAFHLDNENKLFSFFKEWNEKIVNRDRQFGFKEDYAGTILIEVYDSKGRKRMSVTLWDAFPINIDNLSLSYSSNDEILTLPVSFTFDDVSYEVDNSSPASNEYIAHMKKRLSVYPKPFSFEWPWDGAIKGMRGFAEGILGKKLTHQLEKKATNIATSKINKKVGISAIPNATKGMNIASKAGVSPASATATKASRLFKF